MHTDIHKQSAVSPVIAVMVMLVLTIVLVSLCCVVGFNLVGNNDLEAKQVFVTAESQNDKSAPMLVTIQGGDKLPEMCGMHVEVNLGSESATGTVDKDTFSVGERVPFSFDKDISDGTYEVHIVGTFKDGSEVTLYIGPMQLGASGSGVEPGEDGNLLLTLVPGVYENGRDSKAYHRFIALMDYTSYGSDPANPQLNGKTVDHWVLTLTIDGDTKESRTFTNANKLIANNVGSKHKVQWPLAGSTAGWNDYSAYSLWAMDNLSPGEHTVSATYTAYTSTNEVISTSKKSVSAYPYAGDDTDDLMNNIISYNLKTDEGNPMSLLNDNLVVNKDKIKWGEQKIDGSKSVGIFINVKNNVDNPTQIILTTEGAAICPTSAWQPYSKDADGNPALISYRGNYLAVNLSTAGATPTANFNVIPTGEAKDGSKSVTITVKLNDKENAEKDIWVTHVTHLTITGY